jgi:hypothetical protein
MKPAERDYGPPILSTMTLGMGSQGPHAYVALVEDRDGAAAMATLRPPKRCRVEAA